MKVAFIGASHWHLDLYLAPFLEAPGVELAGISDPTQKWRASERTVRM